MLLSSPYCAPLPPLIGSGCHYAHHFAVLPPLTLVSNWAYDLPRVCDRGQSYAQSSPPPSLISTYCLQTTKKSSVCQPGAKGKEGPPPPSGPPGRGTASTVHGRALCHVRLLYWHGTARYGHSAVASATRSMHESWRLRPASPLRAVHLIRSPVVATSTLQLLSCRRDRLHTCHSSFCFALGSRNGQAA